MPTSKFSAVSTPHNSKSQHYVWKYYLSAWASTGTFCCYRHKDKKHFATLPKSVANETFFYETPRLTAGDRKFLADFIAQSTSPVLRKINDDYVRLTQLSFELRERLGRTDLPPAVRTSVEEELRWTERNSGERYHAGIENKCRTILDSLRNENDDFYQDESGCIDFVYFLSLQYFRTAKMRDSLGGIPPYAPGHDPRRTARLFAVSTLETN